MPYILPIPPPHTTFSYSEPTNHSSSSSSSSSSSPEPSPPPSPPRRPRNRPIFPAFNTNTNASSGRLPLLPRAPAQNAMLTTPIPASRSKAIFASAITSSSPVEPPAESPMGVRFPSSDPDISARSVAVPNQAKATVVARVASGNNLASRPAPPQSSPRALFYTGPSKSPSRSGGLRLDLGGVHKGLGLRSDEATLTTEHTPANAKHARSRSHQDLTPRPTSSFIRKKSGELVKPSLKQSSSSMFVSRTHDNHQGLSVITAGLPTTIGSRSEPTTPTGSKSVHFDAKLEHVKLFLAEQKPRAVSRDGSPTETSEGGDDFFSYVKSSDDEKIRKAIEIKVVNMPGIAALEEIERQGLDVLLESLTLEDDARVIRGLVLVRNLAFGKWVAARFTMDQWQTTSEVTGRYVSGVKDGAFDRFEFFIRLGDVLPKIWEKTLEVAIRFTCDGRGDMWDSNAGQNYRIIFNRKTIPVKPYEDSDDDDARVKVAALKKSLETVAQTSAKPRSSHLRGSSAPAAVTPSPTQQHAPSFVNNQSAAEVLSRVGKQGRGSPITVAPPGPTSNQDGPLSPRRNLEGTLAARYDFGSSLKSTAAWSSPAPVPFPRATSPLRSPPPTFSSFSSMPFSPRSLARGSPRDIQTPGSQEHSPPFRTSSDGDIPASFVGDTPMGHETQKRGSYFDALRLDVKFGMSSTGLQSPPMSRSNSFPPLLVSPLEAPKTTVPWGTGLLENAIMTSSSITPPESESPKSSMTSTPSITSNSSSSSSPLTPTEPLGPPLKLDHPDRGEYGQFTQSLYVSPAANHPNMSSFLDQYCFYTGLESGLTPRRAHSTSSVSEYFVPLERSADSGAATPTRAPFKTIHSTANNGNSSPRADILASRAPTPVAG